MIMRYDEAKIEEVVVNFYSKSFTTTTSNHAYEEIFQGVNFSSLNEEHVAKLSKPFLAEEILVTLKGMHLTKALNQTGFMLFFIKNIGILWRGL